MDIIKAYRNSIAGIGSASEFAEIIGFLIEFSAKVF